MVVLSVADYQKVVNSISAFEGLWIECDAVQRKKFPQIDPVTISSIVAREGQNRVRHQHSLVSRDIKRIVRDYETLANPRVGGAEQNTIQDDILLKMAGEMRFSPISLCRLLLAEKYPDLDKKKVSEMLKNPNDIPDLTLALNVLKCQMNDNLDGQITDNIRRFIGEEYELVLKRKSKEAGLEFYDEGDLRRTGYDKTPDLKLAIPCLFRGTPIQWIESKASFGDMESHKKYIRDQLSSYANRFGAGIVIYWFGYLETIATCPENGSSIIVTDQFPTADELELLKL